MPRRSALWASVLALLLLASAFPGRASADSGLQVPRFVTLRSDEVNVRTGPGTRYPVEWVFVRQDLPVEVIEEFEEWRKIRDWEGTQGWVHQSLLSGRRGVVVQGQGRSAAPVALRHDPRPDAAVVAEAEQGVIGRLLRCPAPSDPAGGWCYVELGNYRGWLARQDLWGVYPDETVE